MKHIKLTSKGIKISLSSLVALLLGIFFFDWIIMFISISLASLLLYDFLSFKTIYKKFKKIKVEPNHIQASIFRKNVISYNIVIESEIDLKIEKESWLSFSQEELKKGKKELTLLLKPNHSGIYKLDGIKSRFKSKFSFFEGLYKIPIKIELTVYPLIYLKIIEAIGLLAKMGYYGIGEFPQPKIGLGTEYAYSREYVQGETIRRIDWKATARHTKLFVKEFHEEKGGTLYILFDTRFPGEITKDELGSYFLSLIMNYVSREVPLIIEIYGKDKLIIKQEIGNKSSILEKVLKYIIDYYKIKLEDIYKIKDIIPSEKLKEILYLFKNEILFKIFDMNNQNYFETKVLFDDKNMESGNINTAYIITSLIKDIEKFVDSFQNLDVYIIYYPKVYLDAESLEESYMAKKYLERTIENLRSLNFKVIPTPE
ncbi:MAG: DUF58 domain-containing protein [Thermoproteota archaeon]|nr:DUF58 domain-containing protein [Thermoproteota archaeon]